MNYTTIICRLCKERAEWRMNRNTHVTLKKFDMQDDDKSWIEFVAMRLMPSSHTTKVTKDKASLIYDISMGKTVDIGKVI